MKLKSLRVKSYRSCINTKFEIQKDLTALIGINGSGKSNILNAILLLKKASNPSRHSSYYRNEDSSSNKSSLEVEVEYKSKTIFIKIKIFYETDEENNDEIINFETTWDFSQLLEVNSTISIPPEMFHFHNIFFNEGLRETKRNILYFGNSKANPEQAQLKKIYPHVNSILNGFSKISYYGASQFSDPSRCPNFIEIDEERLIRRYRSNGQHERFITDLYQSYKDKKGRKYELYLNTVNKSGIGLVDAIIFKEVPIPSSAYKVMSGGQVKTYLKNRLLIVPSFVIDGNTLSPSQLSEGTFRTLALLYYLLTDDNELLLIEEPEVCVHHGLLSSIISLIKSQSKNKQIIVSTHSDFVLDQLKPENIILVDKVANKGTLAKSLTKSMTKSDYDGLKTYLRNSGNLGDYWKESGFQNE